MPLNSQISNNQPFSFNANAPSPYQSDNLNTNSNNNFPVNKDSKMSDVFSMGNNPGAFILSENPNVYIALEKLADLAVRYNFFYTEYSEQVSHCVKNSAISQKYSADKVEKVIQYSIDFFALRSMTNKAFDSKITENPVSSGYANPVLSANPVSSGYANPVLSANPVSSGYANPVLSANPVSSGYANPVLSGFVNLEDTGNQGIINKKRNMYQMSSAFEEHDSLKRQKLDDRTSFLEKALESPTSLNKQEITSLRFVPVNQSLGNEVQDQIDESWTEDQKEMYIERKQNPIMRSTTYWFTDDIRKDCIKVRCGFIMNIIDREKAVEVLARNYKYACIESASINKCISNKNTTAAAFKLIFHPEMTHREKTAWFIDKFTSIMQESIYYYKNSIPFEDINLMDDDTATHNGRILQSLQRLSHSAGKPVDNIAKYFNFFAKQYIDIYKFGSTLNSLN